MVDTNILAYYTLPGPRSGDADALLRGPKKWAAPLLWRSELRNVLASQIRKNGMHVEDAMRAMNRASLALLGGEHAVEDKIVLDLISASQCTAYDCEFVALANAIGCVLVTEDKALLKAFPKVCRPLAEAAAGNIARG